MKNQIIKTGSQVNNERLLFGLKKDYVYYSFGFFSFILLILIILFFGGAFLTALIIISLLMGYYLKKLYPKFTAHSMSGDLDFYKKNKIYW